MLSLPLSKVIVCAERELLFFFFPLPEIELLRVILDFFFFVIICYLFHLSVPLFKVFGNVMVGLTLQPYTLLHSSSKWVTASDCSLEHISVNNNNKFL